MYRAASAEGKEFRIRVGVEVGKDSGDTQTVMITRDDEGKAVLRIVRFFIAEKRPLGAACPECGSNVERHATFGRGPDHEVATKICLECATLWDV
jgi:hypothetical protein